MKTTPVVNSKQTEKEKVVGMTDKQKETIPQRMQRLRRDHREKLSALCDTLVYFAVCFFAHLRAGTRIRTLPQRMQRLRRDHREKLSALCDTLVALRFAFLLT